MVFVASAPTQRKITPIGLGIRGMSVAPKKSAASPKTGKKMAEEVLKPAEWEKTLNWVQELLGHRFLGI